VSDRWFQHFKKVLNIRSIYDKSVLDTFPTSPPLLHLGDPPTMAELKDAMSRLKTRKTGGLSQSWFCLVVVTCFDASCVEGRLYF